MRIDEQVHVESAFDDCHRAAYVEQNAIGMRAGNCETVRLREGDEHLVLLFRRAEHFGELLRCQILMIMRAGWVINLLEQIGDRKSTRLNSSHLGISYSV